MLPGDIGNIGGGARGPAETNMRENWKSRGYEKILIDSAFSYAILLDGESRILYFTDSLLRLAAIDDGGKFIGMPVMDACALLFSDAGFVAQAARRVGRVMAGEADFYEDDIVIWPAGEKRFYRISYRKITLGGGNVGVAKSDGGGDGGGNGFGGEGGSCGVGVGKSGGAGVLIFSQDITDFRLHEAERILNDLLHSTLLPCIIWDEGGNAAAFNEEAAKAFGVAADMPADAFGRFFAAEAQPECQPDGSRTEDLRRGMIREALERGFSQAKFLLRKSGGAPLHFTANAARVSWLFGYRLVVYLHDMTAIMQKESEAKEAELRARLMFDSMPFTANFFDGNCVLIDCNLETLNYFGISDKKEYIGRFYDFSPEIQPCGKPSRQLVAEYLRQALEKGVIRFEWMHRKLDGEPLPCEITLVRMKFRDEHYVTGYARDLREIKAKEKEIREIAERERKAEMLSEAAQAANEAKSLFLANMSHEIRTPMNAVLGMSELLLHEKLNKRQAGYADDINKSATTLLNIINDILDVSKIQAGKFSLVPAHYNINALIESVCSLAAFLVRDKGLEFKLFMDGFERPYLYGDSVRLRQVLLNLLGNSAKFTETGFVHLHVRAGADKVYFTVSDTGVGIKPESMPTLFDAFEQADLAKNSAKTGTGLGLTIVKSIIDMMGGKITVESVYGQGTSFSFEIPKIEGDETGIFRAGSAEAPIYAPGAAVLVVDDNIVNLNVARGLLRLYHIKADAAMSGRHALELVKKKKYDIVFMDHRMPGMDGLETTKRMRSLGVRIPIISLTASAVIGVREMMLGAGMDDYISKPIMKDELRRALKEWLPKDKLLMQPDERHGGGGADRRPGRDEADQRLSRDESDQRLGHDGSGCAGNDEFWAKISRIKEISVTAGLDRAGGGVDLFVKSLKLMIGEIGKCEKNLTRFISSGDLKGFHVEAHGIKSSLAYVGATELSAAAHGLEMASGAADADYCSQNLPGFLKRLASLRSGLAGAFSAADGAPHGGRGARIRASVGDPGPYEPVSVGDHNPHEPVSGGAPGPHELVSILKRLADAISGLDLEHIEYETSMLDSAGGRADLKEEIELIKDAVAVMDYEAAAGRVNTLLAGEDGSFGRKGA